MTEANITHQYSIDDKNNTISNRCQNVNVTSEVDGTLRNCNILENAKMSNTNITVLGLSQNVTNFVLNETNLSTTAPSVNKIQSGDTLLKYIYKTSDTTVDAEKIRGNSKNNLSRKKRSEINEENKYVVPANFNYAAVHNKEREELLVDPDIKANVIKNADLADFNIETIHVNLATPGTAFHNANNVKTTSNANTYGQQHDKDKIFNSEEQIESITHRNSDTGRTYTSIENIGRDDTSLENTRLENINRDDTTREDTSRENASREDTGLKNSRRDDTSLENTRLENINRDDTTREDTSQENASREDTGLKNSRHDDTSSENSSHEELNKELFEESKEKNSQESYEKSKENSEESNESSENSKESLKSENKLGKNNSRNVPANGDFKNISSEESNESNEKSSIHQKFKNNSNGRSLLDSNVSNNEKFLDSDESLLNPLKSKLVKDINSSLHSSPYLQPKYLGNKTNYFNGKYLNSDLKSDLSLEDSTENSDEISQIHINDGEVKPVIELNNEENSDEISKENQDGPQSLPLKGTSENNAEESNFKKGVESSDVKQQFERIPLNYKHKDNGTSDSILETSTNDSNEADGNENASDKPPVKDGKYDENLNFKFDDVSIKLPEIKLPDDILDYAYEPINRNEDESKASYPEYADKKWSPQSYKAYPDTYDLDLDLYQKNKKNSKNKDKLRHKYSRQENEDKDDQENDDDEDLYEKFVRERFGKRGSFTKRSEQLKARPEVENHELFKTIQNVLKKTNNIQKEADKSADPNAGYLWTLEYGEKLR